VIWTFWLQHALAAPACEALPQGVVHRWPLEQDGRDLRGERSAAPSDGVIWPSFWAPVSLARRLDSYATLRGHARFVITGLELPARFTLEGWFVPHSAAVRVRLYQLEQDGASVALDLDPLRQELIFLDPGGTEHRWAVGPSEGPRRFGLEVDEAGAVRLLADREAWAVPRASALPPGPGTLQIGGSEQLSAELDVRDVALHASSALLLPEDPWCLPQARGPVPFLEGSGDGSVKLTMDGYFLGWMGQVEGDGWVARQRLVLGPIVHLSPVTRVAVAARTLEPKALHRTGSTLRPLESRLTARGEFGLVIEHAFLARYVGEWRVLPFYFVAGRVPLTFGLGLGDRNALAQLGPSPRSTVALLDGVQAGVFPSTNPDLVGVASFGSTLDGAMLFLGSPPTRARTGNLRTAFGARWGRRNPWCAAREGVAWLCPEEPAAVYEVAGTAVVQRQVRAGPGQEAGVLQLEGGTRWADELVPTWFLRGGASFTTARRGLFWMDTALEALVERGLPEANVAPELEGSLFAAVGHADLATRHAPWIQLSVDGGLTGGLGQMPIRGLHPDYNVDLVLFSQVLAEATATAAEPDPATAETFVAPRLLPTLGGVTNATFVRYGPVIRIGSRSGIELPLVLAHASALQGIPSLMDRGWLGTELQTGLRLSSESWRLAAEVGLLWPGRALLPAQDHVTAWELRVGRNL
jgi:hypothetical protein